MADLETHLIVLHEDAFQEVIVPGVEEEICQTVHLNLQEELPQDDNLHEETVVSEVVILSDIAEETVVTTSKDLAASNQDDLVIPELQTTNVFHKETTCEIRNSDMKTADDLEESFQTSLPPEIEWNDVIKRFQDGSGIDVIKMEPHKFVAVYPSGEAEELSDSAYQHENSDISIREISKREKDKQKKREQRADPCFRAREKEKNRKRMKEKRSDPSYREVERQRDRGRRKIVRHTNEELRNRERERDREYRRYQRETDREYKEQLLGSDDSSLMTDPIMEMNLI